MHAHVAIVISVKRGRHPTQIIASFLNIRCTICDEGKGVLTRDGMAQGNGNGGVWDARCLYFPTRRRIIFTSHALQQYLHTNLS